MKEKIDKKIGINIDAKNMTDADYRNFIDSLGKIEIRLVEKTGQCIHQLGETYVYSIPYRRPEKVCYALLHVLELYNWRVALGVPGWNQGDREVHRVHCPDRSGTVWEMRRIE